MVSVALYGGRGSKTDHPPFHIGAVLIFSPGGYFGKGVLRMNDLKEVYFDEYCHKCQHEEKKESEDPCYDCLGQGYNVDSHKPVNFKEKTNE